MSPSVSELVTKMGGEAVDELLPFFPRKPCRSQCDGSSACYAATSTTQNNLLVDLLNFYYNYCSHLQNLDDGSNPAGNCRLLTMFMVQIKDRMPSDSCFFATSTPFYPQESLLSRYPRDRFAGKNSPRDWRAGVSDMITLKAHTAQEDILRKVDEVCYDLESRCYNTEAPLRQVEGERDQSIEEARQLEGSNKELQSQLQEAYNTISRLQEDISRVGDHAEHVSKCSDELTANLDEARRELEEQHQLSERTVHAEKESARSTELELIATITERDDRVEELQAELREHGATKEYLLCNLESVTKEKDMSSEDAVLAKQEIAKLKEALEESNSHSVQNYEESQRLFADKEHMMEEIHSLEAKARNVFILEVTMFADTSCSWRREIQSTIHWCPNIVR